MKKKALVPYIKTTIIIGGFLLIAFLSSYRVFSQMTASVLRTPFGVLEENGKSLLYHQGNAKNPLLKVSPFDDYIYLANGEKKHLFDESNKVSTSVLHSPLDAFFYHVRQLTFPVNTLTFHIAGEDGDVLYTASLSAKSLTVSRDITKISEQIVAYGNAAVMCNQCLITDSSNTVYFSGVYTTNQKLFTASTKHFTPLLIREDLPVGVSQIYIANTDGKRLWGITGNDVIHYEEPWRLLEVKSISPIQNLQINL